MSKINKNLKLSLLSKNSNNISINNNNNNLNTISSTKTSFNKSYTKRNNFNQTKTDRTQILSLIKSIEDEDDKNKTLIINGKKIRKKKSIFHFLPQREKKLKLKKNFLL